MAAAAAGRGGGAHRRGGGGGGGGGGRSPGGWVEGRDVPAAADVPPEWPALQRGYAARAVVKDTIDAAHVAYIGGCDLSFSATDPTTADACITVLRRSDLTPVLVRHRVVRVDVPFIPGYLAFREAPPLVAMWEEVRRDAEANPAIHFPDVILVDGNGIMHTRRCGVATQMGVLLGVPTIGVAKTYFHVDRIAGDTVAAAADAHLAAAGEWFTLRGDGDFEWCGVLRSAAPSARSPPRRVAGTRPATLRASHVGDWYRGGRFVPAAGAAAAVASAAVAAAGTAVAPAAAAPREGAVGGADAGEDDEGEWTVVSHHHDRGVAGSAGGGAGGGHPARAGGDRAHHRPVFVSVGTGLSLPTAVRLVAECCVVRVPEPIRLADKASRATIAAVDSGS